MLARAARSQALRAVRAPVVRRGMCTAVEATETIGPMSIKKQEVQLFVASAVVLYGGALRWQSIDRSMAKEAAAKKAAHDEAHPPAVVEEVAATPAPAAASVTVTPAVAAVMAAPAPSVSVTSWKTSDVVTWLTAVELPMHADAFKAHSIDGTMLLVLTEEDLYKSLGVASPLHRKKIMLAIGELRKGFLGSK